MIFLILVSFSNIIILVSSSCTQNVNNCLKCNPLTDLCVICSNPDFYTPDGNGGCVCSKKCKVGENYCNKCDIDNKLCISCDEYSHPDEIGGCTIAENCKISYKGICLECKDNFVLIGRQKEFKICKSIFSTDFNNCEKINKENGKCQTCKEGYFLNPGDNKCIHIENCYESIFGNCVLCNPGYYYNKKSDACERKNDKFFLCKQTIDGDKCDICDEGRYFDKEGLCSFGNYCSKSAKGYCDKCVDGYFLAKNKFCSFTENCYNADTDVGICTECETGFYLDKKDYKCKSNKENSKFNYCKKAENDLCIQCENDFYLTKERKCATTINCEVSENGICIKCIENYYLGLDKKCVNVEHCIYSKNEQCLECEKNYFLNKLGKNCTKSVGIFENCKISNNGTVCSQCHSDFYLRMNDSLCIDNTKEGQFYKCEISNDQGDQCEVCLNGYFIGSEDKRCSLVENCSVSENEKNCIKCIDYFCLDVKKGICVSNKLIKNESDKIYFACNKTDEEGLKCVECLDGYEVGEKGYCVDMERCEEKIDGICLRCKNNTLEKGNKYCANDLYGCVATSDDYCIKCNDLLKLDTCTECKEGYKVGIYGYCIKKYE